MAENDETLEHLRIDPKVIQFVQNQQIIKYLRSIDKRLNAVEARGIPFDRSKLFNRKTLAAGESATVYYYNVRPLVAFIWYVGCSWFPKTHYNWTIDNVLREKVERIYGYPSAPMSQPFKLAKPLIAKDNIRWVAYNNDDEPHVFDVYHDGILHSPEVAKQLGGAR